MRKREDLNGKTTENIAKLRLVNFDVSTVFDFDYRISLSLEVKIPSFTESGTERRKRASICENGVQCDLTEFGEGEDFQVEVEGEEIGGVVDGIREICAVLSDFCDVYEGYGEDGEERKGEGSGAGSEVGREEDISDEFD